MKSESQRTSNLAGRRVHDRKMLAYFRRKIEMKKCKTDDGPVSSTSDNSN